MPSVAASDVARMREKLFFEGEDRARKLSAFWTLLLLASAGVVSTATVIGAMIVAPTPRIDGPRTMARDGAP